jgi:predicted ArsR family transcriptional regulator
MVDGKWRTLREIADALTIPEASASARLRDLRKERFGNYQVERQRRGEGRKGLFEYRMGGIPHCAALPSEAN